MDSDLSYVAFAGSRLVAAGDLRALLTGAKAYLDQGDDRQVLIFERESGRQVEFDFRGTLDEVLARELPAPVKAGPGRPKLGVVSREVTLLPRHWAWLDAQSNGTSAALRRLVEHASKHETGKQRARRVRDAAGKLMWTLAGDRPGFEEASRVLFAGDLARFEELVAKWPKDVRECLVTMLAESVRLEGEGTPEATASGG